MLLQADGFIEKVAKLGIMDTACELTSVKDSKIAKKSDGTKSKAVRGKRVFVATYAILVSSEIFLQDIYTLPPALKVLFEYLNLDGSPIT